MAITRWTNVPGTLQIECWEDTFDICIDLIIKFRSTGYRDTGSMYGGSDNLGWAPEGDDERFLDEAYLEVFPTATPDNSFRVDLPKERQQELFERFREDIQEIELDTEE